jgi:hypothetical protein
MNLFYDNFIFNFFIYRSSRSVRFTSEAILQALDDIPSDSDISGAEDDSFDDETYVPREEVDDREEDDDIPDLVDRGVEMDIVEAGGGTDEEELPDLDVSAVCNAAGPPAKRRRASCKERKEWVWQERDLEAREMPINKVKPKNLQGCTLDVHYFMKLFGRENITLLTVQTNIVRVEMDIKKNRAVPPISETEIRQVIGILMYVSVVSMPHIRLFWSLSLRHAAVANVMKRKRFEQIISFLHLSDNNLQPARGSPAYDRLYKVRQLLVNLSRNFRQHADMEEILSVDEMMIPFKGQLGLKV